MKFIILRRTGFTGTGSSPPRENGLHLSTRHTASAPPIMTPHSLKDKRAYSEQVGLNLHDGALFAPDKNLRYAITGKDKIFPGIEKTKSRARSARFRKRDHRPKFSFSIWSPRRLLTVDKIRLVKAVFQVATNFLHLQDR